MPIKKVFFNNSRGMKLVGWLHVPKGKGPWPAVVRTHGWKSSKEGSSSTALVDVFKDMVFLRFDMHGHGESEGTIEQLDAALCVDDVKSAVDFIATLPQVDKHRIAVTGSSLGGLSAVLAAAWSEKIALCVPICPVSDFYPLRKSKVKYQNLVKLLGQDNVYKAVEKSQIPFLIIHGDQDPVIALSQSVELVKHLKLGTLHIIPGADHIFSKREHFEHMIEQIGEFIHKAFKQNGKDT